MFKFLISFAGALMFLMPELANAQNDARMFRFPDVSETQIVFTYGGDLWLVAKEGGFAKKLSSPKGDEYMARFSPNGKTIAFTGNYGGNRDVYTIPATGGVPKRVTYHGGTDLLLDWHPTKNELLFASRRQSGRQRFKELFTVSAQGGLPKKLPISYGDLACFSPDGTKLAFNFNSRINRTWKRYRGGMAPEIHIFDANEQKSYNITNNTANDEFPMWIENTIYYLSDQGPAKRHNIWAYNTENKSHTQITKFTDFDIHFPSQGAGDIVFEAGGKMYLLNTNTKEYREVNVKVITDQLSVIPKQINPKKYNSYTGLSPKGNRVVIEARGDIFSVPSDKGVTKNLTRTSNIAERYPAWSPNGKHLAYWSDKSGEYQLHLYNNTTGEETVKTNFENGYRYPLYWSPDSKHIVFINQLMEMFIYSPENDKLHKFDTGNGSNHYGNESFRFNWSPDSKWVAYDRSVNQNNDVIFLYNVEKDEKHQVTSEFYDNYGPVFDPEGKYLYCRTQRHMQPVYSDFDGTFIYPNSTQIAAIPLASKIASPLAAENDEVEIEKQEEEKKKKKKDDEEKDEADQEKDIEIDIDNFEQRMVILPIDAGRYGKLVAVKGKLIFREYPNVGSGDNKTPLKYFDLKEKEVKTILNDVDGYDVTADGKKILVFSGNNMAVIDVGENKKIDKNVNLSHLSMTVDPKAEWKQIYWDAWRMERDFFYDKNMHGVDWKAVGKQYAPLIDMCVTRSDVNYVLGEMIGEMNASHAYVGGGDTERAKRKKVGYLGIDWELANGAYRIKQIVRGAPWDAEVRSPLDESGIDAKEGDYILAVNGVPIDIKEEPYKAFQDMAKETIELTVNDKPTLKDAKKVIVKTMSSERRLRHLAWMEQNRKRVDEATNGRIGYIYVRSTGWDGQNELMRQFAAQYHKDGLIIDERFNNGGQIPDRFIELLNRQPLAKWAVRTKKDWQWPSIANFGPKVMMINGWSGSGGDAFPDFFRKAGLGKLVGTRTWGGLIGISGAPELIDGGSVTVPTFRMYHPDGTWFREGHGVDPDIEVPENPAELATGKDAQLEKAIEVVLEELKSFQPPKDHEPYETR